MQLNQKTEPKLPKLHLGQIRVAANLWQSYQEAQFPQLDKWIAGEFRKHKSFGKKDRRFYSDTLFSIARYGWLLAFVAYELGRQKKLHSDSENKSAKDNCSKGDFDNLRADIATYFESVETYKDIQARLRAQSSPVLAKGAILRSAFADGLLSSGSDDAQFSQDPDFALLYSILREIKCLAESDSSLNLDSNSEVRLLWYGFPGWSRALLHLRSQTSNWTIQEIDQFLNNHQSRPPVWLRLNRENLVSKLEEDIVSKGFHFHRVGSAFAVTGETSIFNLPLYESGGVEIQDLASQAIGNALSIKRGDFVWDACAGGGGKTLQIASLLGGSGSVYASDVRPWKLDEIKRRASKASFFNIRSLEWDGTKGNLPLFGAEVARHGGFDHVLVDAPCSSSGTWRRNPDAKLRSDLSQIDELNALQIKILKSASQGVRKGGTLVYATCSFLVQENEEVVSKFLSSEREFELIKQEIHGNPDTDSDSTFTAVMKRREG